MKSLVINIKDDTIVDKVLWMLEHFKNDGLEIISKEDIKPKNSFLKRTAAQQRSVSGCCEGVFFGFLNFFVDIWKFLLEKYKVALHVHY